MSQFKMAQRRSMLDTFRQNFDVSTKALSLFDRKFRDFFDLLQTADEEARELAMNLSPYKKGAAAQLSEKNYLGCAEQLGRFYDTMGQINKAFITIEKTLETENYSILVDHLDDDVKQYLHEQTKNAAAIRLAEFTKQAGLFDWLKDSIYSRRRAINALEKKFPFFKNLSHGLAQEVKRLDVVFISTLKIFKLMSVAIAKGDISEYEKNIKAFADLFGPHNKRFRAFFATNVKPFGEYLKKQLEMSRPTVSESVSDETPKSTENLQVPDLDLPEAALPTESPAQIHEESADEEELSDASVAPMGNFMSGPTNTFTSTPKYEMPQSYKPTAPMGNYLSGPTNTFTSTPKSEVQQAIQKVLQKNPVKRPVKAPVPGKVPMKPATKPAEPVVNVMPKEVIQDQHQARDMFDSHAAFISRISLMKNASVSELTDTILAYSESVQDTDPEASLRLFAIVEGIVERQ